jgi:hypothetical protein
MKRRSLAVGVATALLFGSGASLYARPDTESPRRRMTAQVVETEDRVEVHVRLPERVDPASLEVRLSGREVLVLARDQEGRRFRTPVLHLGSAAVEENASAFDEGGGWITVTLRRIPGESTP